MGLNPNHVPPTCQQHAPACPRPSGQCKNLHIFHVAGAMPLPPRHGVREGCLQHHCSPVFQYNSNVCLLAFDLHIHGKPKLGAFASGKACKLAAAGWWSRQLPGSFSLKPLLSSFRSIWRMALVPREHLMCHCSQPSWHEARHVAVHVGYVGANQFTGHGRTLQRGFKEDLACCSGIGKATAHERRLLLNVPKGQSALLSLVGGG